MWRAYWVFLEMLIVEDESVFRLGPGINSKGHRTYNERKLDDKKWLDVDERDTIIADL